MFNQILSVFTRLKPYKYVGQNVLCNLCGSSRRETVGTRDRYLNPLHTAMCTDCGLVATDPMPTEEEVTKYYTRDYRKHYHNIEAPREKDVRAHSARAVERYAALSSAMPAGAKVLDVGSGGGEFVACLQKNGVDASGLEPNEGFANYSRTTYDIPVISAMWPDVKIEKDSLDFVTAHHVLEHFRDPCAALIRFREWLKPGGHLYISVPDICNAANTPMSRFHFAHVYNFTPQTLRMMAFKAGYEEADIFETGTTTVVFRKIDAPDPNWFFATEHAARMREFFATNTNMRFIFSGKVMQRWLDKLKASIDKRQARVAH